MGKLNKSIIKVILFVFIYCFSSYAKILDTLVIQGLKWQPLSFVRNSIGLKEHSEFSLQDIQQAIKNLYKSGFFKNVDFYLINETDSSASLLCLITEYPTVEIIEFTGNKKFKQKDFEEKITIKKGMPCKDALVFENVQIIKKLYAEKGFLLADIQTEIIPTRIPGNVLVKFKINEGSKVVLKKIFFKGNKDIKEGKLKWVFKTKERQFFWGGDFDKEKMKKNLDSLIIFYNNQGYINAYVVKDSIWFENNNKELYLLIEINEGKKYYTGDFFFSGNKIMETSDLERLVLVKKGKPFIKSKFEETKEYIASFYREEGYLWVQVREQLNYRNDTIDVTFDITEGKAAIVRKIDVTGNLKTKEKVIRREMAVLPGEKYKQSYVMRSVRNIYQLNFFSNVKPDLKPNDDGTVDLEFNVQEKDNIGQLSLGASYSEVDGFMGTFTTSIPNFRGEGQKLDLSFEYGQRRQDVSLGFTEPWAFNTPTSLYGSIYYLKRSYYGDLTQYGFIGNVSRRLKWPDDYFSVSIGYELAWKEESDTQRTYFPSSASKLQPRGVSSKLSLSLNRDDTDMPKFPNQGSRFNISPEIAGLAGDYKYIKTQVNYDWYFPLFWKFVLCTRAKFGVFSFFPGSDTIKYSRYDAFRGGGSWITDGIIRGYDDMTFGGYYHPEKGLSLMAIGAEVRFPVLEQVLYLSVFGDIGNTWESISQINFLDVYPGAGFGIRIDIPMLGLLGFDLGYGFRNPQSFSHFDTRPNGWKFGFQLGRGF
jgi:outer membrane protein insertion porin family